MASHLPTDTKTFADQTVRNSMDTKKACPIFRSAKSLNRATKSTSRIINVHVLKKEDAIDLFCVPLREIFFLSESIMVTD